MEDMTKTLWCAFLVHSVPVVKDSIFFVPVLYTF